MALCQYTRAVNKNHVNHFDTMLHHVIFQLNCCERETTTGNGKNLRLDLLRLRIFFSFAMDGWMDGSYIIRLNPQNSVSMNMNTEQFNTQRMQLLVSDKFVPCFHVLESFTVICFVLNYVFGWFVCLFVCLCFLFYFYFFLQHNGMWTISFLYKTINLVVFSNFFVLSSFIWIKL